MSRLRPNRIDRPGTAEESWASWLELRHLPAADPLAWASVAVVAAHPDDEVLGVGGTMAILAAAGVRLRLIAVTDGEASHPGADPAALRRVRAEETAAALAALGAGPLCHDEAHARRVADLTVYLRQHHAERNLAELGTLVAGHGTSW